ncbi:uncharacterized protein F4822DRAFT_150888 [Hypoxylon trugodes]|uniref:uncharacterized protein n=1 Tax=Hypoxylon trugodes TaxID=326681 RepID=UPI0021919E63|nr:uncharacterized protein F4822DRAFT_150888 [Hypoxylon trugodes]KAI1382532.1 hypothetical protein F4822DRAFT_150888 [Hypoxylon trugodes]
MNIDNRKKTCKNKPSQLSNPLNSRLSKRYQRKLEPSRQAKAMTLAAILIRHDMVNFFFYQYKPVLFEWIALVRKTTIPAGVSSRDPSILTAFRALDARTFVTRQIPLLDTWWSLLL